MTILSSSLLLVLLQAPSAIDFKLALPSRPGQLSWHADGFNVVEASAKPGGVEIGIRGQNGEGRSFLGFLFVFREQAPMTSSKCREGIMEPAKKANSKLRVTATSQVVNAGDIPVELVSYTVPLEGNRTSYVARAFIAKGEICGDLEIYSEKPIQLDDPGLKPIFDSYRLDLAYQPSLANKMLYGQILYSHGMFGAAAPIYEEALKHVNDQTPDRLRIQRVLTDQAGMSYGMSGEVKKARSIFETAIKSDPDYPMYYYNLACADAEENKLKEARNHLEQAFARKANMLPGEKFPDPSVDDSFLRHRTNKEFWSFILTLK